MTSQAVYVERNNDLLPVIHRPSGEHPETICGEGRVQWPMMQQSLAEQKGALLCPDCYPKEAHGTGVAL